MAIEISYGNGAFAKANGLKEYFDRYNNTFEQPGHPTSAQGFSTVNSTAAVVNGVNYGSTFADLQYAGETSQGGSTSAFIAEAKPGGPVGQLVYTLFSNPTHTLFGDLDTIKLGEGLSNTSGLYSLGTTEVSITNLTSVLNEGMSGGAPVHWDSGSGDAYDIGPNDVHNVIYPLMSGHGGNGSTAGLEHYFNLYGVVYNGTTQAEVFDGFDAADVFKVGGGTDTIQFFDVTEDVINLGGLSSFGSEAAAAAAVDYDESPGNAVLVYGGYQVTIEGVTGGLSASNFDLV